MAQVNDRRDHHTDQVECRHADNANAAVTATVAAVAATAATVVAAAAAARLSSYNSKKRQIAKDNEWQSHQVVCVSFHRARMPVLLFTAES